MRVQGNIPYYWLIPGDYKSMGTIRGIPRNVPPPKKRGLLDPWKGWLEEQRESGNHNASQMRREMVAKEFTGSGTIVRDAVARWRKGWLPPPDFLPLPV